MNLNETVLIEILDIKKNWPRKSRSVYGGTSSIIGWHPSSYIASLNWPQCIDRQWWWLKFQNRTDSELVDRIQIVSSSS